MEINRNSRLYRFAYWTGPEPSKVNICRFFWRLVMATFIYNWLILLLYVVGMVFVSVIGFLFAHRVAFESAEPVVPFKHWPTIKGHLVYPIYLVPIIILALFFDQIKQLHNYITVSHFPVWSVAITAAGAITVTLAIIFLKSEDTRKVVWAYLRAKKEKVCPMISIVD